jgi:quercetin dioxygenase-like cupin family protein
MRRPLTVLAAVVAMLGWLQLAPAFGFPVIAPAAILDRIFGPSREAGLVGLTLLWLGLAGVVAVYFLVIEPLARGRIAALAFAIGAWLVSGGVVMPVVALLQGPTAAADPMHAEFFMLNLGVGAAAESLIGWLLFGAVLAAGQAHVTARTLAMAVGAAALAAALALIIPGLSSQTSSGRVVEGRLAALPTGPVFISVLELPQPAGAVLGPHSHIAGFVVDIAGTSTMVVGGNVVDVGPGDAVFTGDQLPHDHENRATVPLAIALAAIIVVLTAGLTVWRGPGQGVPLMVVLLIAGTVATVNPFMNDWFFIGVRQATARGALMPVPAAHRTYESANLTGLVSGPYVERLTDRRIAPSESVRVGGPAAIIVLDGRASLAAEGGRTLLSARSGMTVAGGSEVVITSDSGSVRVLLVQLLPAN